MSSKNVDRHLSMKRVVVSSNYILTGTENMMKVRKEIKEKNELSSEQLDNNN